ncbi:MAG: MFS transporter [marine bacterium B5-7]|nr:MAG: MFS transporter [marine bacterium B5-7]
MRLLIAKDDARIVLPLASAQTLTWAMTFYMFPAMLLTWEGAFDWGKAAITGAFTLALLLSAIVAPLAGRLVDRGYGRLTMACSMVLAAVMLVTLSLSGSRVGFYLAWAGIGIAMGGALYEVCFAFVTHLSADAARRRITTITLIAGFAGTVSFPTTYVLNQSFGWPITLRIYAAVALLVVVPLILSVRGKAAPLLRESSNDKHYSVSQAMRSPIFWLLAAGFALIALDHGVLMTHLLPILVERHQPLELAVLAASLIGPMQVVGRLAMIVLGRRLPMLSISLFSIAGLVLAAINLYVAAYAGILSALFAGILIACFVVLQGAGYGVTSIARPVLTAEWLGRAHFGAISGVMGALYMLMMALSPSIASGLWYVGGYDLVIAFVIGCALLSFVCMSMVSRLRN